MFATRPVGENSAVARAPPLQSTPARAPRRLEATKAALRTVLRMVIVVVAALAGLELGRQLALHGLGERGGRARDPAALGGALLLGSLFAALARLLARRIWREQPTTCPVCLDDVESGEPTRSLPCAHVFHASCVDAWLSQRPACPLCRSSVGCSAIALRADEAGSYPKDLHV